VNQQGQHREYLYVDEIEALTSKHIPEGYRLVAVRLHHPRIFEIQIEYQCLFDEALQGTLDEIKAFQGWSNPLIKVIREHWPREDLIISFLQRLP